MQSNNIELNPNNALESMQLTPEQKAGMRIAAVLLWMIGGVILLYALICLEHGCGRSRAPALPNAAVSENVLPVRISSPLPASMNVELDFAFHNLQYVLNILLPVFTTVLGYILGNRSRG